MAITLNGTASDIRTSLGLGTASTLDVGTGANNVVQLDGSGNLPAVNAAALTNVAGGKVVNFWQNTSTTQFSTTSATHVNVISVNVQPSSSSNKMLVIYQGQQLINTSGRTLYFNLYTNRSGGGFLMGGDNRMEGAGSWRKPVQLFVIDEPNSTSAFYYSAEMYVQSGGTGYDSYAGAQRSIMVFEIEPN